MSLRATVLIPTFDHGPTLLRSVPSALGQTVEDVEVFVVGDGVPDVTREIMAELVRSDGRVRFFDNPKGPRHGELHRHAALQHARGEVVCYLSDDDMWASDHLETMCRLLERADLAHTLVAAVLPDQRWLLGRIDLALAWYRMRLLAGLGHLPLSFVGHTLAMYRRLPQGWRTTPPGTATDVYMWQQFLADDTCRAASAHRLTVLNFPSAERRDWSTDRRLAELDQWRSGWADREWRHQAVERLLAQASLDRTAVWSLYEDARGFLDLPGGKPADGSAKRASLRERLARLPLVGRALRSADTAPAEQEGR
jgi:GalNAc5-diNAcBac-PP-undecaprenol beta-1,3-glucosyltransferase